MYTLSVVPGPSSPQWLVQNNKYLGRPALQVGLRDVEIGERESVWPSFRSVYEVSLEGCMMLWDLT